MTYMYVGAIDPHRCVRRALGMERLALQRSNIGDLGLALPSCRVVGGQNKMNDWEVFKNPARE